jgi:hypothetical protein
VIIIFVDFQFSAKYFWAIFLKRNVLIQVLLDLGKNAKKLPKVFL